MPELNKIYNQDCLEGMKLIPDGSVDMVLCDLPYGSTSLKWDNKIDIEKFWEQIKRITKDNAAICLFSQMPFGAELIMSNKKMFRYEWIWEKNVGAGFLHAHKMPLRAHENILVFYRKLPTYNPQKTKTKQGHGRSNNKLKTKCYPIGGKNSETYVYNDDGTRFPFDVQKFKTPNTTSEKPIHSTQKPVDLCEYLIKTYTNENEVVFDACMGSGTTAIAAINTNRQFIGFELDKEYYEKSLERIEKARENLFAD